MVEKWRNRKIRRYCEDDVRITKEIYEYALKNKHLKYRDIEGAHSFSVDTSLWEKKEETSVNFTLPSKNIAFSFFSQYTFLLSGG